MVKREEKLGAIVTVSGVEGGEEGVGVWVGVKLYKVIPANNTASSLIQYSTVLPLRLHRVT
jgi:hypothetical protein